MMEEKEVKIESITDIEKKIDKSIEIKKKLSNIGWYNFTAYFLYGFAVAMALYNYKMYALAAGIAVVGFGTNLLSIKNMGELKKLL
jgi:hypothetical protein